jgi:hypothetical protein
VKMMRMVGLVVVAGTFATGALASVLLLPPDMTAKIEGGRMLVNVSASEKPEAIEAAARKAGAKIVATFPGAMTRLVLLDPQNATPEAVARLMPGQPGALVFENGYLVQTIPFEGQQGKKMEPQPWLLVIWGSGPREHMDAVAKEIQTLAGMPGLKLEDAPPLAGQGGVGVRRKLLALVGTPLLQAFLLFFNTAKLGQACLDYGP